MNARLPSAAILALAIAISGCGGDDEEEPASRAIATFNVLNEEFKVELTTPSLVEHAQELLDGKALRAIPMGRVMRDDSDVNQPWSWHLDPTTVEFADVAIEVCDGPPSYVEDEVITSDTYCPWSAEIVSVEPVSS